MAAHRQVTEVDVPLERELELDVEASAVPRARHFVARCLADFPHPAVVHDAELVVSELVTNSLLHARTNITVRLTADDDCVRVEVYDESTAEPLRAVAGSGSMTGRGISVVEEVTSRWGVDSTNSGKVVWAELVLHDEGTREPVDRGGPVDALRPWSDAPTPTDQPGTYTVTLGDVPTELLVAAKEHMDNVVREFTLAASGAATGSSAQIPVEMGQLLDTVVNRFAHARHSIKRQALAALARGDERTKLTLTLSVDSADAAEAYLAALDETDVYARTAKILTLETPPQHRAFRHWYVGSLISQLRQLARGEVPQRSTTFEEHLLEQLDLVASAREATESLASRLGHLQQLTAQLTRVTAADEIADIVVGHSTEAFGAIFSSLYVVDGNMLRCLKTRGATRGRESAWQAMPIDAPVPICEAVRTNAPIVVEGRKELSQRYPALTFQDLEDVTVICVPLSVGDTALGAIALTFPLHRDVAATDEVQFLASLADACAQALDRAQALTDARQTADKLAFLADASGELAATLDYRTTLTNVANLVVPRLADWCAIQILDGDRIDNVAVAHVDPDKVRLALDLQRRYPPDLDNPTGAAKVIRSGVSELYPVITDEMLVSTARDAEHLRLARELSLSSAMVVPMVGSAGTFGAITMMYAESGRHYTDDDRVLAEELGHRAALAVEHARRYQQQSGKLAAITRIAEAVQHAILAPVPPQVGPVQLAASYVSAAKEALVGGDLYEVVPTPHGVRLLVGDVRGKGLDAVRLATVVLGLFRSAAVGDASMAQVARRMDHRLTTFLEDEDFVTALLLEISDSGESRIVCCGHPTPLLARGGQLTQIECPPTVPLGLGSTPTTVDLPLEPGDRLLLYTDGLVEARRGSGEFTDLLEIAAPIVAGPLAAGLEGILEKLQAATGTELGDDLALLAAEYAPGAADEPPQDGRAAV